MPVAGKPMMEWSLAAFRGCEAVAAIVVAAPPGHEYEFEGVGEAGAAVAGSEGPGHSGALAPKVVAGGATRAESVANALAAVESPLVAIHDAARPLLTSALVDALLVTLAGAPEAAAVIAAAPVTDTIKRVAMSRTAKPGSGTEKAVLDAEVGLEVEATEDRSALWAAQTPQVFRTEALRAALEVPVAARDAATDEAMLVEAAGGTVLIHPTGPENLKVTTPHDLRVAELILAERAAAVGG